MSDTTPWWSGAGSRSIVLSLVGRRARLCAHSWRAGLAAWFTRSESARLSAAGCAGGAGVSRSRRSGGIVGASDGCRCGGTSAVQSSATACASFSSCGGPWGCRTNVGGCSSGSARARCGQHSRKVLLGCCRRGACAGVSVTGVGGAPLCVGRDPCVAGRVS